MKYSLSRHNEFYFCGNLKKATLQIVSSIENQAFSICCSLHGATSMTVKTITKNMAFVSLFLSCTFFCKYHFDLSAICPPFCDTNQNFFYFICGSE